MIKCPNNNIYNKLYINWITLDTIVVVKCPKVVTKIVHTYFQSTKSAQLAAG